MKIVGTWKVAIVFCMLSVFLLSTGVAHAADVVFEDTELEAAVRSALSMHPIQPITEEDMLGLTRLNIDGGFKSITSLTGLEYATNLTELNLVNTQVADISPLSSLTNLTMLYLANNPMADISPLSSLTNLRRLELNNTQVTDISPLSSLTNLTMLGLQSIENNPITDISPLSSLTNLTYLSVTLTQITDISSLSSLTNLTCLNLFENTQITDISPLASLTNLTYLGLSGTQITDISPLASLTNLTTLGLSGTQITDISLLGSLTNLTTLGIQNTQITDISPLSSLTNLKSLILFENTQITDISPLASLTNLTTLGLSGTQITDISLLGSLTNVRRLELNNTQITDISLLGSLTNLTELSLVNAQITDISPLSSLTSLTFLSLAGNQITDISALVSNSGLDGGDQIIVQNNYLDLAPGSDDMANINILTGRGVWVCYEPQSINTHSGPNVEVMPHPIVTLLFDNVTTAGNTTATKVPEPKDAPSGFKFLSDIYDIQTTAAVTPPIALTFSFPDAGDETEQSYELEHYVGGDWITVPTSIDTVNNTITGTVDSLSPFTIVEPTETPSAPGPGISTGINTYWIMVQALALMLAGGWLMRRRASY